MGVLSKKLLDIIVCMIWSRPIPAGETVPSAARFGCPFSILLQLQQVLLFTSCLQHLLQRGELTHGLRGNLPALHCVGSLLPFHCCWEPAVSPPGGNAAVGRAVAVIAVVPSPRPRFTAVNFWDIVPDLEQSTRPCLCLTGAALWHHTDLRQRGHWAYGGLEWAHSVVSCSYSTSSSTTVILRRLVVSQGVDLTRAGWSGLFLPGWGNSQATQFGATGDAGPQKGILLGHGDSAGSGQHIGVQHELWIQGAERPALGGGTVRLETDTEDMNHPDNKVAPLKMHNIMY